MMEYRLGLYEKAMPESLALEEKLLFAKKAGFDFLEISIDETEEKIARLDMTAEKICQLNRRMVEENFFIETMCLSAHRKYSLGSEDPGNSKKAMDIMEKAIMLAVRLGVRIIQLAGYDVYYEGSNEKTVYNFEKNLCKAVSLAGTYGVVLAFETMETEFINTVEKAMYWVNKLSSPYLLIYPDSGNITNALQNKDVAFDLFKGRSHIAALHLKESLPGKYRDLYFGDGYVQFREIIHAAYVLGIRRYLAEFWAGDRENWQAEVEKARIFLRNLLDAECAETIQS